MTLNDVWNNRLLQFTTSNGSNARGDISIPRIKLQQHHLTNQPCEWDRIKLLARLVYAITINKRQGQTLAKIRVWLVNYVFGQGQLYVAAFIIGVRSSLMCAVMPCKPDYLFFTINLVYMHMLDYIKLKVHIKI
jgi:hypothetical protein